ncbi:hypothetical protein [Paraburkholderia terricola]|uniref:Uncharacterized protein n=1 Tax=Paraburkholderia terricola TaxID=169427 RepID=A0A1M6V2B4_9BURK|nr:MULTISPECIES: hypothetical protein [Paraburkholderia]SDO94227.1 hypothetical protein SAMN05192547_103364 [Paraburkholderia sediminicola]SHK75593.1 hypothetical protein SAMN05192548_103660 [Paraburkholderia terricola]
MSDSILIKHVKHCIDKIGCNEVMRVVTTTVWFALEHFIAQYSATPTRLEDLDVALLARFVETRSQGCVDVELLLLEITSIRMVLLESGFLHNQLTGLSVRVKRERLANDKNGKYRFAKTLCT